jgi:superoxide reductase
MMPEKLEVYKCDACGNIVEVTHGGGGELICCGQPMKLLVENTVDASQEKHVPVIEKTLTGFKVKVGTVAHPMEENHYIEWIELHVGDKVYRQHLKPGDPPEGKFCLSGTKGVAKALVCGGGDHPDSELCTPATPLIVREYCNVHGLWKNHF